MTRRSCGRTVASASSWDGSNCSVRSPKREIGDPVMMHDPTAVTDGIEVSPDDQIIAARRGAYLVSVAQRTGGWQQRGMLGAVSANGAPEPALAAAVSLPSATTVSKE